MKNASLPLNNMMTSATTLTATLAMLALFSAPAYSAAPAQPAALPFTPPAADSIPDNEFGKIVKKGEGEFNRSLQHIVM